jgi:CelD/BcsL family acetyltransferase involved in cellulose biosynthesis
MTVLEPADDRWLAFIATQAGAYVFHHPAWLSVLADTYGFKPFVVTTIEQGVVRSGVPLTAVGALLRQQRWVSLPFSDICGPLGSNPQQLMAEVAAAARAQGTRRVEFRSAIDGLPSARVGYLHTLDITRSLDDLHAGFRKSRVQRGIRQAERNGVVVEAVVSETEFVETFFRLHVLTRKKLGVPVQPLRFFTALWRRMIEPGHGTVLVARRHDRAVAAAVFLRWNEHASYKFGASSPADLQLRPNHLLMWRGIQWAREVGATVFDFGRTEPEHEGLLEFKRGWGVQESELRYSYIGGLAAQGSGRATRLVGSVIKRSPPSVARVIGAAAYRYSA